MILEEESGEDLVIFEGEINTHHMDMMGHVIHIFHTFFILVFWNYLFLECVDDVLPFFLWSYNHSEFPLKEEEAALHLESKHIFEEDKREEES